MKAIWDIKRGPEKMVTEIWAIIDDYSGIPERPKYDKCPNKKKGLWFVP